MTTKGNDDSYAGPSLRSATSHQRRKFNKNERTSYGTYHRFEQMDVMSSIKVAASKQAMDDRVNAARMKLERSQKDGNARMESICDETMDVFVECIAESFSLCSPFMEGALMAAFKRNPKRIEEVLQRSCINVLSAPIRPSEWEWMQLS